MSRHRNSLPLPDYVLRKCRKSGDGCLIWIGCLTTRSGPYFALAGVTEHNPRRILWKESGRTLRAGFMFFKPACHPQCLEPEHQNYRHRALVLRSMNKAGRMNTPARAAKLALLARARSSMNDDMVLRMRERYADVVDVSLVAREFGVSREQAYRVCTYKSWRITTPFSGLAR